MSQPHPPDAPTTPPGRPALAAAGIEPMLALDDLAAALNVSRRAVERLKSAGRLPRPDLTVGRLPRWRPDSIRRWIDAGGKGASQ